MLFLNIVCLAVVLTHSALEALAAKVDGAARLQAETAAKLARERRRRRDLHNTVMGESQGQGSKGTCGWPHPS
jgi:hypothetical protein